MHLKKNGALFSALIVLALASATPSRAADYSKEAAQLAQEIIATHPRGHEIARSPEFVAARAALAAMAGTADLPHYAMALGRMFHGANDGHTAVIPFYSDLPEFTSRYPLRLRRFEDGLYVVAAKNEAKPLLGARLTRIADQEIEVILRRFVKTSAFGNRAWPANWIATAMTIPGYLAGLDVAPDATHSPVVFEGSLADGSVVSSRLAADADGHSGLDSPSRKKSPLEDAGGGAANFVTTISGALVLVLGAMEDEPEQSFAAFTDKVGSELQNTQAQRVIIDLRDNGGGNNMLAEPLRRLLVKSRFNKPGGIYVLISSQTFSAAMNFATRLERETDALFVGEPTGGSPNHFGDPNFAQAPESGLVYIISTLRWQDMPPYDKREWILPDLPAPARFEDFLNGRDSALQQALNHVAADGPAWRARIATPWERESQRKGWRFFYELHSDG